MNCNNYYGSSSMGSMNPQHRFPIRQTRINRRTTDRLTRVEDTQTNLIEALHKVFNEIKTAVNNLNQRCSSIEEQISDVKRLQSQDSFGIAAMRIKLNRVDELVQENKSNFNSYIDTTDNTLLKLMQKDTEIIEEQKELRNVNSRVGQLNDNLTSVSQTLGSLVYTSDAYAYHTEGTMIETQRKLASVADRLISMSQGVTTQVNVLDNETAAIKNETAAIKNEMATIKNALSQLLAAMPEQGN